MRSYQVSPLAASAPSAVFSRRGFLFLTAAGIAGCTTANSRQAPTAQYAILAEQFATGYFLYSEFPDQSLPSASIVKLLIAIALIETGQLRSGGGARISKRAYAARNLLFPGSIVGDSVPVETLLGYMIRQSDNFSSNVLISYLGTNRIDAIADRVGLSKTRVHGLFVDTDAPLVPRGYTSARECNKMLRYILSNARNTGALHHREYRSLIAMMQEQSDRRLIPSLVPAGMQVADKTGEIHGEINDAAILEPLGALPILISVLVHGAFDVSDLSSYGQAVTTIQNHLRVVVNDVLAKNG